MDRNEADQIFPEESSARSSLPQQFDSVCEVHHAVEGDHKESFITLTEGESSLPEIQRLQGLFESIDHELEDIQVTHVSSGFESDLESDDGLKQEVRELPNSSILDLHTISTSAKGSHFLVTPSSATKSYSGDGEDFHLHHSLDFPATPFAAARHSRSVESIPENDAEYAQDEAQGVYNSGTAQINATPARVTFGSVHTDDHNPSQSLDDLQDTVSTPSAYNNKTPMSAGQHGFTPMTLQELMRLETPESKVDEMLQELYNLMGYYNREAEYLDALGVNNNVNSSSSDINSESGSDRVVLFGSPSPVSGSGGGGGGGGGGSDLSGVVEGAELTPPLTPTNTTNTTTDDTTKTVPAISTTTTSTTTSAATTVHPLDTPSRSRLRSASVDFDLDIQDIMQMSIQPPTTTTTHTSTSPTPFMHINTNTGLSYPAPHSPLDRSTFRAGWVDVSSKHTTPHHTPLHTPHKNTNTSTASTSTKHHSANKLHESIVHGDFYIWSSGAKLTAESINSGYVGMNRTSVTHNNENGVLVPATLPSPSVPGSQLPREVNLHAITPHTNNTNNASHPTSTTNTTHNTAHAAHAARDTKHGYYVVYLLECVVRPDIELRDLLACVLKVARTRDCKAIFLHNNHVVLKSQSSQGVQLPSHTHHSSSSASNTTSSTTTVAPINVEWDQVDVQVVVSNAVKQRMLVCQFLRRVPSLTSSGFGNLNLIIYQIAGGAAPLTLENSPKTKSFVSKLKRELTEANLCLSSLYNAPLDSVCRLPQPGGLDAHFRAQLHQQVYGHMWSRLEGDVKGMSEHLQAQLKECNEFMHTLEPIYKTYGMPNPLPWSSAASHRHQTSLTSSTSASASAGMSSSVSSSVHSTPVHSSVGGGHDVHSGVRNGVNILNSPTSAAKSLHDAHNIHISHTMHNTHASHIHTPATTVNGISIAPSTADRILDNYLNNSTPVHTTSNTTSNTTPFKTTTDTNDATSYTDTTTPYATTTTPFSNTTNTLSIDTPHTPTTPHATTQSATTSPLPAKYAAVEDGMTIVLLTLTDTIQELQESCDAEYARRVQMQNEWVVRQVDHMQDYKQSLLFTIAANLDAEDSALMKSFTAAFHDVPTTVDVFGNTAFKSRDSSSRGNSRSSSRTNSAEKTVGGVLVSSIVGGMVGNVPLHQHGTQHGHVYSPHLHTDTGSADAHAHTTTSTTNTAATPGTSTTAATTNTSSTTTTTTPGTHVYSDVLVEASLFNEFLDSPPPKPLHSGSGGSGGGATNATASGVGTSSTTITKTNNAASNNTTTTTTTTPSKGGWMSSLISSFYNNPVTQENASIGFKPKELRPKQTQADVNRRLSNYHTQNTTGTSNVNNNNTDTNNNAVRNLRSNSAEYTTGTHIHQSDGKGLSMDDYQEVESLISLTPIVLYYCSCLVAKMPGTVYITPTTLCVTYSSGLLTMHKTKEIYPLTALHAVYLPSEWQASAGNSSKHGNGSGGSNNASSGNMASMLNSNALQLVFYKTNLSPVKMHLGSARSSSVPSSRDLLIAPMLLDCVKLRNIIVEVKNAFNS